MVNIFAIGASAAASLSVRSRYSTAFFAVLIDTVTHRKHNFRVFEYHGKESGYPHPEERARAADDERDGNADDIADAKRSRERNGKRTQGRNAPISFS